MITEWLIDVGAGFGEWVAGLFPTLELPDELVHVDDMIQDVFDYGDGLGAWIAWGVVGPLLAIPLAVWVAGLTIRAVRALIAHLPFVGGKG